MMAPVTTTRYVLLQCKGTAKNGKACSFIFGETNGSFRRRDCPRCGTPFEYLQQRVEVYSASDVAVDE